MNVNILINEIININNKWKNLDYCLHVIRKKGRDLKYAKIQTLEMCVAAVQEDG